MINQCLAAGYNYLRRKELNLGKGGDGLMDSLLDYHLILDQLQVR